MNRIKIEAAKDAIAEAFRLLTEAFGEHPRPSSWIECECPLCKCRREVKGVLVRIDSAISWVRIVTGEVASEVEDDR